MSSGSFVRRPAVLLALALCSVGGLVTLLGRLATGPRVDQKRVPLTTEAGAKSFAAFSPDGQRIAYSARGVSKMDAYHLYVRTVAADIPRQLTEGTGNDVGPAWSPDGNSLAFLRMDGEHAQYVVVPVGGGAERKVAEFTAADEEGRFSPSVAWTKDGKSMVVVQTGENQVAGLAVVEIATGKVTRITNPPDGTEGDSCPAVSPDGAALAFVRNTSNDGADVFLTDLAGSKPRPLTFDNSGIRGIAWTPDGHDLVYSANRARGWSVWRIPAYGGSPRELPIAGQRAQYPAVAPAGNHMAFTDSPSVSQIWRATLGSSDTPTDDRPLIRSAGSETSPMYSEDGKKIADISDQTGADEIWVSDADGGNRVRITNFNGPPIWRLRWSPDGKTMLFDMRGDRGQDLFTVPAAAGAKPTRLVSGSWNGSWSRDGKRIYYDSRNQIWKASVDGGNPEPLVQDFGVAQGVESVDGKYVYYRHYRSYWRVPVSGGEGEEVIVPDHDLPFSTTIQPTKRGVYYSEFQRSTRSQLVSLYDYATKKSSIVFQIKMGNFGFNPGHVFSISPDGKYIIYPIVDSNQTDLILVENFR